MLPDPSQPLPPSAPLGAPAPTTPPPVVIQASAAPSVTGTSIGMMLLLVSGFLTLLPLIRTGDVVAIQVFIRDNGVAFLSAASALFGTAAWRIITTVRRHAKSVIAAHSADDKDAIVVDSSGRKVAP